MAVGCPKLTELLRLWCCTIVDLQLILLEECRLLCAGWTWPVI